MHFDRQIEIENNPENPEIPMPLQPSIIGDISKELPPEKYSRAFPLNNQKLNFSDSSDFHRGPRNNGKGYKLVAWSFVAASIDGLLVISLLSFFAISAHLLVRMSFVDVRNLSQELPVLPLLLVAAFLFFYMSTQRVFMGHTIGEWACGLRLGQAKQRLARYYGLRVCLRSLFVIGTGLVLFPILSALSGRDLVGRILRLPLIQLDPGLH